MDLLPNTLEALTALGTESTVSADSLLWREGDPGDGVVILLEGVLEVTHESPEGDEVVLRTVEPGAVLGEIASLDRRKRSAAVKAATPARILKIEGQAFRDLLRERPEILEELFWVQVERVRTLTDEVARHHRRSIIDRTTRLYNLTFFKDRLRTELWRAREAGDVVSLALFDIDHFSDYNDAHGQIQGNQVLGRVAEALRTATRRGDILARWGSDAFAVLMYGAGRADAVKLADEIRQRVEATEFPVDGGAAARLTVSAGVASCPQDATRADRIIDAAELDLSGAQADGGNRVGPAGS